MRIVHLSDLHFWRLTWNPFLLCNKRILGMSNLLFQRARVFELDFLPVLVDRVKSLNADHVLITGDLTSTSLDEEFVGIRAALEPLLQNPEGITILPGNHDRYLKSTLKTFERYFAKWMGGEGYPVVRTLGENLQLVALDPCRPNAFDATGYIPPEQIAAVDHLDIESKKLLVACHYPILVPFTFEHTQPGHEMLGADRLLSWVKKAKDCLYFHGHIHIPWVFRHPSLPGVLHVNAGAAIMRYATGVIGEFLELEMNEREVIIYRHYFKKDEWQKVMISEDEILKE